MTEPNVGRLYLHGKDLGEVRMSFAAPVVRGSTPDEDRLGHFSVTAHIPVNTATLRLINQIRVSKVCGYDPQRLLEYKPETLAEWASRQGWPDRGINIQHQRIPHLFPGEKIEMMPYPEVDFGQCEARIVTSMTRKRAPTFHHYEMGASSFREALEKNARFDAYLAQRRAACEAVFNRYLFNAMLDIYVTKSPRDARIQRLLSSRDPRQRKRGKRLGRHRPLWPAVVYPAKVEDDLTRWHNTKIGEPYDPANYRKD